MLTFGTTAVAVKRLRPPFVANWNIALRIISF
jgi:hypothetical protein